MTPQEALFAELFNHEKILVKDMETLELRAHREELVKIAFEARARLTAVDAEDRERTAKRNKDGKPTGFERSLHTDEVTSEAINTIKERQKKLSKMEKVKEGLIKMGMSEADAEKMISAGTLLNQLRKHGDNKPAVEETNSALGKKKFVNPFKE